MLCHKPHRKARAHEHGGHESDPERSDEEHVLAPDAQPRDIGDRTDKSIVEPEGQDHGPAADPRDEIGEAHEHPPQDGAWEGEWL